MSTDPETVHSAPKQINEPVAMSVSIAPLSKKPVADPENATVESVTVAPSSRNT